MIERWIAGDLLGALSARRGVHLTGARQTGKTTLTKMLALPESKRLSLDNDTQLDAAKLSPSDFVNRNGMKTLIIDEIQKAPELLNAIKINVDNDNSRSQYLLTGSANLRFVKAVKDSLAGRFATVRLRTLTVAEANGRKPDFLGRAFNGRFDANSGHFSKKDVIHAAFTCGYPEQLELTEKERRRWHRGYIADLMSRDVKDVTEIRKIETLSQMAEWLMAHTAQFFSVEEMCSKLSVAKTTAETYMDTLRALYLFDKLPAWGKGDYDRAGKRPKWVVADTGLVAAMLRWNEQDMVLAPESGKFIETWVYHELASQADASGDYEISHFRDRYGREIDYIIENDTGDILGIEVKAGSRVGAEDFKHLKWFGNNLCDHDFVGIVFYTGAEVLSFGERLFAVPMASLT